MNSAVSVIISTYNSSQFVIETLDSVSNQDYDNIELIITDDCSTDKTVEICERWLNENGTRFSNTILLESKINTGVSANANRGLANAKGEWIKFLGADDTLLPNCLSDNIQYVSKNPQVVVLFSAVNIFRDTFDEKNFVVTIPGEIDHTSILYPDRTADSQYRMLLVSDRINFTPSVFLHRKTLISIGGFDERFRLLEDYPLWLNLTKRGYKLYYMDKITVNYRRHSKAINNTGKRYIVNPNYFKNEIFRSIYIYPYLPLDVKLHQRFVWYMSQVFRLDILNKDNVLNRIIYSLLVSFLNPFKYIIWIKKKFYGVKKNIEFYS